MSINVQIEVVDRVTPALSETMRALGPAVVKPVIGRAVVNRIRQHLFAKNAAEPNKLGGRRTNFYAKAGRSAHFTGQPDGVAVGINQLGFRQRYFGGEIKPRPGKKYLTLPAIAAAHGRRAGEFQGLTFGIVPDPKSGKNRPALLGPKGVAVFWLVRKVRQAADKTVLPPIPELQAEASKAIGAVYRRAVERGQSRGR